MYQQVEKTKGNERKVINNAVINNLCINTFPINNRNQKKWLDLSSTRVNNRFQYIVVNKKNAIQKINKVREEATEYHRQADLGNEEPDTTIDGNRQAIQHYERAIELRRAVANNYGHMGQKHALAINELQEKIRTRIMKISSILSN
ncbi:hypothetical protein [Shewanella sp.]|uniref:hypothetical protein n=1 Tax=Shewanella sp. TaxID=50422 RepID=UPI004053E9D2